MGQRWKTCIRNHYAALTVFQRRWGTRWPPPGPEYWNSFYRMNLYGGRLHRLSSVGVKVHKLESNKEESLLSKIEGSDTNCPTFNTGLNSICNFKLFENQYSIYVVLKQIHPLARQTNINHCLSAANLILYKYPTCRKCFERLGSREITGNSYCRAYKLHSPLILDHKH